MGRKSQHVFGGQRRRFVPHSFDNDKDPAPVAVWYRVPTEREKREIFSIGERVRLVDGGSVVVESSAADELSRQHHAIRLLVEEVENYSTATGEPINTGSKLAEHGESAIVFEVVSELFGSMSLTADLEKKREGSPAT